MGCPTQQIDAIIMDAALAQGIPVTEVRAVLTNRLQRTNTYIRNYQHSDN
jgi:hypothetical protein